MQALWEKQRQLRPAASVDGADADVRAGVREPIAFRLR